MELSQETINYTKKKSNYFINLSENDKDFYLSDVYKVFNKPIFYNLSNDPIIKSYEEILEKKLKEKFKF